VPAGPPPHIRRRRTESSVVWREQKKLNETLFLSFQGCQQDTPDQEFHLTDSDFEVETCGKVKENGKRLRISVFPSTFVLTVNPQHDTRPALNGDRGSCRRLKKQLVLTMGH
jgi:hypothetical protein